MTEQTLADIEARANAATPGPIRSWQSDYYDTSQSALDLVAEVRRLRGALEHAEGELSRIIGGVWTARNSVESMLFWLHRIRREIHAALTQEASP